MIQIDMPMPTNCIDCPACNEYLMCAIPANGRGWGENDVKDFSQGRPEWCPMKEQEAVTGSADVEKVKQGLKFHISPYCDTKDETCPYWLNQYCGAKRKNCEKNLAVDALSVIEEQQGRIDNMLSLLDEADMEKERLKEEIELLKAQPTIPAIMKL